MNFKVLRDAQKVKNVSKPCSYGFSGINCEDGIFKIFFRFIQFYIVKLKRYSFS